MHAKPLFNSPTRPVRKETRTSAKPGELHGPLHERERLPLQVSILIGEVWEGDKGNGHCSCYGGQGGRTWQAFGGGKNGHETFRQAHIYNFRDKCVVFARNLKFSNLTQ